MLISDRISSYHRYVGAHAELFTLTSVEQCTTVAGNLIEDWLENQSIHRELKYYNDHKALLKEHPIFEKNAIRDRIYALTLVELVKRRHASQKSLREVENALKDEEMSPKVRARREKIKWTRELELQFIDERLNQTK